MKPFSSTLALATALTLAFGAAPAFAGASLEAAEAAEEGEQSQALEATDDDREADPHYRGNIIVAAEGLRELDFIGGRMSSASLKSSGISAGNSAIC